METTLISPHSEPARTPVAGVSPQMQGNATGTQCKGARPREKKPLPFDELFSTKTFTRFYTIKSTSEADLTRLNLFKVDKAITFLIGRCTRVSENFASKTWTVEVKFDQQGQTLGRMSDLLSEPVVIVPHEVHNQSKGVVTCGILKTFTEEDIVEGLSEHCVIRCRWIVRNPRSPHPEPTATLILTFNTSVLPDSIQIRTGLVERVRLYIPLPRRCFNCQRYGHSSAKCRRPVPICEHCGRDIAGDHPRDRCHLPPSCYHCEEPHSTSSKSCPSTGYQD